MPSSHLSFYSSQELIYEITLDYLGGDAPNKLVGAHPSAFVRHQVKLHDNTSAPSGAKLLERESRDSERIRTAVVRFEGAPHLGHVCYRCRMFRGRFRGRSHLLANVERAFNRFHVSNRATDDRLVRQSHEHVIWVAAIRVVMLQFNDLALQLREVGAASRVADVHLLSNVEVHLRPFKMSMSTEMASVTSTDTMTICSHAGLVFCAVAIM